MESFADGRKKRLSAHLSALVARLGREYAPELGIEPVVQEVLDSHQAVVVLDLDDQQHGLELIELVARQRLDVRCGRVDDNARVLGTRRRTQAQMAGPEPVPS